MPVMPLVTRLVIGTVIVVGLIALPAAAEPLRGGAIHAQLFGAPPLRGVAASDNDNERDCDQYDDNDNDVGPNLVKSGLRAFCEFEEARDTEIDNLDELIEEIAEAAREGRQQPSPEQIAARRAAIQGLVRAAVLERLTARAGQESVVALAGNRVVLHLFPTLTRDLIFTLLLVDPTTLPSTPGTAIRGFAVELRAQGTDGGNVPTLPAEARLSAVYEDQQVAGLDKSRLVLARLDPSDNQWRDAPKAAGDPQNNYVSATITEMGTYIIYQR